MSVLPTALDASGLPVLPSGLPASPRILVVIPAYNEERYILETVSRILAQTFRQFWLLVVDDESTDRTPEILAGIRDERLILFRGKHGQVGISMLALGLAQAHGIPMIARQDADDLACHTRLETQHALLSTHDEVVACSNNAYYINEAEEVVGSSTVPMWDALIRWELRHGLRGMIHGSSMFRTDALAKVGGWRQQLEPAEDQDLFLRLSEVGRLRNVRDYLYRIRLRTDSVSTAGAFSNRQMLAYAIACAENRAKGLDELDFQTFLETMGWVQQAHLYRDFYALESWRMSMRAGWARWPLRALSLGLDPKRGLARAWRRLG